MKAWWQILKETGKRVGSNCLWGVELGSTDRSGRGCSRLKSQLGQMSKLAQSCAWQLMLAVGWKLSLGCLIKILLEIFRQYYLFILLYTSITSIKIEINLNLKVWTVHAIWKISKKEGYKVYSKVRKTNTQKCFSL